MSQKVNEKDIDSKEPNDSTGDKKVKFRVGRSRESESGLDNVKKGDVRTKSRRHRHHHHRSHRHQPADVSPSQPKASQDTLSLDVGNEEVKRNKRKRVDCDERSVETLSVNDGSVSEQTTPKKRRKTEESEPSVTSSKVQEVEVTVEVTEGPALEKKTFLEHMVTLTSLNSSGPSEGGLDERMKEILDRLTESESEVTNQVSLQMSKLMAVMTERLNSAEFLENLNYWIESQEDVYLPCITLFGCLFIFLNTLNIRGEDASEEQSLFPKGSSNDLCFKSIHKIFANTVLKSPQTITDAEIGSKKAKNDSDGTSTKVITTDENLEKVMHSPQVNDGEFQNKTKANTTTTKKTEKKRVSKKRKEKDGSSKAQDKVKNPKKSSKKASAPAQNPKKGENKSSTGEEKIKPSLPVTPRVPPKKLLKIVYKDGQFPLPFKNKNEPAALMDKRFTLNNLVKAIYVDGDMNITWWYVFIYYAESGQVWVKYAKKKYLTDNGLYFDAKKHGDPHQTKVEKITFDKVFGKSSKSDKFKCDVPVFPENALPPSAGFKKPIVIRHEPFTDEIIKTVREKLQKEDGKKKQVDKNEKKALESTSAEEQKKPVIEKSNTQKEVIEEMSCSTSSNSTNRSILESESSGSCSRSTDSISSDSGRGEEMVKMLQSKVEEEEGDDSGEVKESDGGSAESFSNSSATDLDRDGENDSSSRLFKTRGSISESDDSRGSGSYSSYSSRSSHSSSSSSVSSSSFESSKSDDNDDDVDYNESQY